MSLIQAALEKSNQSVKEKKLVRPKILPAFHQSAAPLAPAAKVKEPVSLPQVKKKDSALPAFLWMLGSIAFAIVIFYSVVNRNKTTGIELTVSPSAMTSSPAIQVAKSLMPDRKTEEILPRYVLSGITMVEGERLALINNQIVRAGDVLTGNVIVKEILIRSVILSSKDNDVRLSL